MLLRWLSGELHSFKTVDTRIQLGIRANANVFCFCFLCFFICCARLKWMTCVTDVMLKTVSFGKVLLIPQRLDELVRIMNSFAVYNACSHGKRGLIYTFAVLMKFCILFFWSRWIQISHQNFAIQNSKSNMADRNLKSACYIYTAFTSNYFGLLFHSLKLYP